MLVSVCAFYSFQFCVAFIRSHILLWCDAIDHTVVVFYALSCSFIEFNAFDFRIDSKGINHFSLFLSNVFFLLTHFTSSLLFVFFPHCSIFILHRIHTRTHKRRKSTIEKWMSERASISLKKKKTVVCSREEMKEKFENVLFDVDVVHNNHLGEVDWALCRRKI